MVDTKPVAVIDRVDDLKEDPTDQLVVAEVPLPLRDHPKQVALLAELQHDVDARLLLDDIVERHDVPVVAGEGVESDLPPLKGPLSLVEADLVEALDGVERLMAEGGMGTRSRMRRRSCGDVPREVDDSIRSQAQDRNELELTIVDPVADQVLRVGRVLRCHGGLGFGVDVGGRDHGRRRRRGGSGAAGGG